MSLESGQILNNRFRVAAQLEKNLYGSLFRAWDLQGQCPCIVKEITAGIPGGIDRWQSLAHALIKLNHPNLQKVIDYSVIPGEGLYLVMEFLEGKTLGEIQNANNGIIEEKEAVTWITQVCGALDLLHKQNPPLIHGSVNPQSIFVTKNGKAVLADFSCALFIHEPGQKEQAPECYKAGYSAPEWHTGKAVDVRSDIYSLGATLYSVLTGIIPQESEKRVEEDSLQAVEKVLPALSPGVARALEHAVSLEPDRRFFNVRAFQNALLSGAGLPVETIPASTGQAPVVVHQNAGIGNAEPVKTKRKWLGWVIAGGVLSLVVIASLILFVVGIGKDFPGMIGLHPTETAQKKVEKTKKPEKEKETEEAVEETEEMPATEEPVIIVTEEPATPVQLEIWHSYSDTAADAFSEIIAAYTNIYSNVSIEQKYVDAMDMYSMFETAMAAGDGPTMIMLVGGDRSASLYDEGYLKDVSGLLSPSLYSNLNEHALEIAQYRDGILGVPFNINGVLLYRNAAIVPEPPSNWDDLIGKATAATAGDITGMVFETGLYFSVGHLYGLGGQLLDEYSGEPLFLDDYGVAWLNAMQSVRDAGLPMVNYTEEDVDSFRDGKTGMIIDGNWNAQSMAEAIGAQNLVIDEWPDGMSGFVQTELISLVNDPEMYKNEEAASIAFMEFLVSEQAQMIWADVACSNHDLSSGVPVIKDLYVADPLVEMAMRAFSGGVPFPTQSQMVFYWDALNTAITNAIDYYMDPWDELQSAHDTIMSQLP